MHTDAWKRSGGLIEVFGSYNAQYTHRCDYPRVMMGKNSALFVIN